MSLPKCPFCLREHDFNQSLKCPNNKLREVPIDFVRNYDQVDTLWLMTIGFKGHGKTCYLAALTLVLENITPAWPDTSALYMDEYTQSRVQEMRRIAEQGDTPAPSLIENPPQPMLIQLANLPGEKNSCLVMFDTPGELFDKVSIAKLPDERKGDFSPQNIAEYMHFLRSIKNIWFLVSVEDLDINRESRIDDLLGTYIERMRRLGESLAGRNLIVIYTKGDKFLTENSPYSLPASVADYMRRDPYLVITDPRQPYDGPIGFSMDGYFDEMKRISNELQEYTRRIPGGAAFIAQAKMQGMGIYFTCTSALGNDPSGGKMMTLDRQRLRILDPFLWSIRLNKIVDEPRKINLVLDAAVGSEAVFRKGIQEYAAALQGMGTITVYFLGRATPASRYNQAPPVKPPSTRRPRLIGPILEAIPPGTPIIVWTAGQILDLEEYKQNWGQHLLHISIGDEDWQNWPKSLVYREHDTVDVVINETRRFLTSL